MRFNIVTPSRFINQQRYIIRSYWISYQFSVFAGLRKKCHLLSKCRKCNYLVHCFPVLVSCIHLLPPILKKKDCVNSNNFLTFSFPVVTVLDFMNYNEKVIIHSCRIRYTHMDAEELENFD